MLRHRPALSALLRFLCALGLSGAVAQSGPAIRYATYLGTSGDERIVATEVDADGNVFLFGSTGNPSAFPAALHVGRNSGAQERCFVAKFNRSGSDLLYAIVFDDTAQLFVDQLVHCDAMTVTATGLIKTVYQSIDRTFVKTLRTITETTAGLSIADTAITALEGFLPVAAITADSAGYVYVIGGCFNRRTQTPSPYPLPNGFRGSPSAGKCTSPDNFFSIGP